MNFRNLAAKYCSPEFRITFRSGLFVMLLLISFSIEAQEKQKDKQDSIDQEIVEVSAKKLLQLRTSQRKDSIQRIELEKQIRLLKITEERKKQELQDEISIMQARDSLHLVQIKNKVDSIKRFSKGYPVVPFGNDTLFFIYYKIGGFTPMDRASVIKKRIQALDDNLNFNPELMSVEHNYPLTEISYDGNVLMTITEYDAVWLNTTTDKLAHDYKTRIAAAVVNYQQETNIKVILGKIGLALLVIVLVAGFIVLIFKLFRWLAVRIEREGNRWIRGIKLRDYELLTINRQVKVILFFINIIKWFTILITVYVALPVLFGFFPWTKKFTGVMLGYILNPLKSIFKSAWNYIPNLITIIVIVTVFFYVLKGIKFLRDEVAKGALRIPGFYPDLANPTFQIIRVLVLAFMLVVIFPYLPGADSPVFQGVSVFLGLLFTFGSSGSLSNMISGLVITFMRSFKIGDRVKIGEVTGDIIEKSILVTRIRTIKNEIVSIPNSNVLTSHLVNYSSDAPELGLILNTTVTIGYDAPWRQVHELLIDAALSTSLIEKEPVPFVFQTSLNDFYVSYQINAYTKAPNQQAYIYALLHQNIQDKFNEAGVEIMSPHYRAGRDGSTVAIPPEYLNKK
jgi:small-conductance mechanosensitive channel